MEVCVCVYEKTPPPLSPSGMGTPHSGRPCPLPSPCWEAWGTALQHSCFSMVTHCSASHSAAGSPGVKAVPVNCALRVPARPGGDQVDGSESWVPDLCPSQRIAGYLDLKAPYPGGRVRIGQREWEHVGGDCQAWADCCLASHRSGLCWSA